MSTSKKRTRNEMPYIEYKSADGVKRITLSNRPLTIGRHPDNRLVLKDDRMSRFHCVIERIDEDNHQLRDLKSKNGVKHNDEKVVESIVLTTDDFFTVGKTLFHFVDPLAEADELNSAGVMENTDHNISSGGNADVANHKNILDDSVADLDVYADYSDVVSPQESGGYDGSIDMPGEVRNYNSILAEFTQQNGGEICDHEHLILQLADAMGDKTFSEKDIALITTRRETLHAAEESGLRRKKKDDSESREGIRVLRLLLLLCFRSRATDLHIEPKSEDFQVRIRVDGTMVDVASLPKTVAGKLTGVVKVLSEIDIAQRNIVQEGHFSTEVPDRRVDYRVSFTPSMHGQKLVIRVLDLSNAPRYLHELNLPPWMFNQIRKISRQDAGMVLACGPTGSGKTTTLYAVLRDIDVRQRNVITIEDPVEYEISGVTQMPINAEHGNTFNNLLRSVLRQDPDVILLGEIRDRETACTAMQAAMTGHLVLSTVHAKDTIGTIFRLLDLGVEPFLVASSLNLVLAQRLVKLLCPNCKVDKKPTPQQTLSMGKYVEGVSEIFFPGGCSSCLDTGFHGRSAIFELLLVTDDMRDVILKTPTIHAMREAIKMTMFTSLQQTGFRLVLDGTTSFDEIERVAGSD